MNQKQIVAFCGCFNPPLNSHFSLAEQIINEYEEIEKVVFVPVNEKYKKVDLTSNEHRYNMLKAVCDKNKRFEVSRLEIDSPEPLYTIQTLREFEKIYPNNEITLVIGSDNLQELDTWKTPDELVKNFKVYVFKRDKANIEEIIEKNEFLKKNKDSFIEVHNNIISNISSTYARQKIREGKSIRYLAPDEVVKYIEENKLFC